MAIDPKLLRKFFAVGATGATLVAAGFYLRGIVAARRPSTGTSLNISPDIKQIATRFKFTKSEGGRSIFTVQAEKFQQFKEGDRYQLHDASIILYGRNGTRSDQIYGSDFEYDKSTGEVVADGEVQIDLEADSPVPGATGTGEPQATKSVVHLKTSGLRFNENTGLAQTRERIEFRIPDAAGSAVGAAYDSRANVLVLKSAVNLTTTGKQKANITGRSATIIRSPDRVILQGARIEQPPRVVETDKLTVMLRPDSSVERILAAGAVHASREGPNGFDVTAPEGDLDMDSASQPRSGSLSGGVTMESRGDSPSQGKAGRVLLSFGAKGKLEKAHAEDAVDFNQGTSGKSQQIEAAAVDLYVSDGKTIEKAVTSAGPAKIVLTQGVTKSTISSGQFEAKFAGQNHLQSILGSSGTSVISTTPGQPDRITSSRDIAATFNAKGEVASAEQTGDFHYQEGERTGSADAAHYNPVDESFLLTGSPRLSDPGSVVTANSIQLNRKTGTAVAQGDVKTTYNQNPQAGGALLASADPIHVTGTSVVASRSPRSARFTAARLWRGADIVEAPTIVFDRDHRSLQAQGNRSRRVESVFVQIDKNGKTTPVYVDADKLTYVDADRKAVYSGNVLVKIEGATITAATAQALLAARGVKAENETASQLDRIVAEGDIKIQQPNRKASGTQLIYSAADEKFVLTGTASHPPSIFDAERGQITGDSLTFFTHDGRVLVGSGDSTPSLAPTKDQNASTK